MKQLGHVLVGTGKHDNLQESHMSGISCRRTRGWLLTACRGSLPPVASTSTSRPAWIGDRSTISIHHVSALSIRW